MKSAPPFALSDLRRLWADDSLSIAQVAAAIGRRPGAMRKIADRLDLPPRRIGPKVKFDPELFTRLWQAGVGAREIAALLGMNRFSLSNAVVRMGLPKRGGGWQPKMTLAQFREADLGQRMAATARAEAGALINAEMVDDAQAFLRAQRRAA